MNKWRVGIMGAGMMSQGFDKPGDNRVLSMAHAFTLLPQFGICGFYDQDVRRAEEAEKKWSCPSTPRSREEWLKNGWDVIYIATPDEYHANDLHDALAQRPRVILVEKPLATDPSEALSLLQKAKGLGVMVMVDYQRRWHSATPKVAELIRTGKVGIPVSAVLTVSGGVIHNLPHALDLFLAWWGGGWRVSFNSRHGSITSLAFSRREVSFEAIVIDQPAQLYYVFEMHIYCSQGKVELSYSPEIVELFYLKPHPAYPAYRVLTPFFRMGMEEEPLLCRTLEELEAVLLDPARGEAAYKRELESQKLMAEVFRYL